MTDVDDPLYCRKYAHNIPPLDSLRCKPLGWDHVNIKGNDNYRKVYFGWNNISQYEKDGIANVKRWLKEQKQCDVPANFGDRNVLKFVQANFFKIDKAGEKLFKHFAWLQTLPNEPKLTNHTLKLLQSGCFYIFGRDKYYRPCLVMDAAVMHRLGKESPESVTSDNFTALFIFLYQYLKNVMFLNGYVDQWVTIVNLGNLGITSLPREQILAFADVCQ